MPHNYEILADDPPRVGRKDDLRPEYDFAALRAADRAQGREYRRQFVRLDSDVAAAFPAAEVVNTALREWLVARSGKPEQRPSG